MNQAENMIELDQLGSDPEFFLLDKKDKRVISAIGIIGGDKDEPVSLENGLVLEDGVTAEINPKPASSRDSFIKNTSLLLEELSDYLKNQYSFVFQDTHLYPLDYLEEIGPKAFKSGCEPFYIKNGNIIDDFSLLDHGGHRFAGGHIHLSFKNPEEVSLPKLLGILDRRLLSTTDYLSGHRQITQLGFRGAHRPKPYGLEYRPLSNVWLRDEQKMAWVWDSVQDSINDYNGENVPIRKFPGGL